MIQNAIQHKGKKLGKYVNIELSCGALDPDAPSPNGDKWNTSVFKATFPTQEIATMAQCYTCTKE